MKEMLQKFDDAVARIESMFLLAGVLANDSLPDQLEEFFEDTDMKEVEGCFGKLPAWLKEELEMGDTGGVIEWLCRENKLGFLVQFATPVMTPTSPTSASFSWGCYTWKWVYGDTLDAALEAGFAFVEEQRKKEKAEANKPKKSKAKKTA